MIAVLIYLLWSAYAMLEGKREAYHWHLKGMRDIEDLHPTFLLQRHTVWLIVAINNPLLSLSLTCSFPFWHLGTMYHYRNVLNPRIYTSGFKSERSNTTTQKIKLFKTLFKTYPRRLAFLILSFVVLAISIIL